MNPDYANIRKNYQHLTLSLDDLEASPLLQLDKWLREAIEVQHPEPTAISLATADSHGQPSLRIVLAKDVSAKGVSFFTNYESRKGQELEKNPLAAITFFWVLLERQVRLEGCIEKLPASESDAYFSSRPRQSQLGAWASNQSKVVSSYQHLEARFKEIENRFEGKPVPRPPYWGGYLLTPHRVEFWQGRPNRMHNRFLYQKESHQWHISHLAP